MTEHSFLFGYGVHIRGLGQKDLDEHGIDLGNSDLGDCVAVEGEDLARSLALVVDLRHKRIVWHDDGIIEGKPLVIVDDPGLLVEGLVQLLAAVHPFVIQPLG